ncbi:MAG: aminotransferase class IV [Bacteroidales bacterium]|nr:aminotransferase class IV [Bacteroidales bacterium]
MENCLHLYFVVDAELRSSCDFHESVFSSVDRVYEIIRIVDSKPLFLSEHIERLQFSCSQSGIALDVSPSGIKSKLKILLESNKVDIGNIKLVINNQHKIDNWKLAAWLVTYSYPDSKLYETGVRLSSIHLQRNDPNVKVQDLHYKSLVQQKLAESGAHELLLLNHGVVKEGSRSNIFFIYNHKIFTAPDEQVLPGITRNKIIQVGHQLDNPVQKQTIHYDDLGRFQAVFMSGTSPKVLVINQIDDYQFDVKHPLIKQIAKEYNNLIDKDIINFKW